MHDDSIDRDAGTGPGAAVTAVFLTAVSLWMGTAAFYSAVVLPVLFTHLPSDQAGAIAALVFPWYFRIGAVLGVIATAAALRMCSGAGIAWRVAAVVLAAMTAAQLYSTLIVHPEVARLRADNAVQGERFQELHRLSVRLNGVVLVGGCLLLSTSGLLLRRRERGT